MKPLNEKELNALLAFLNSHEKVYTRDAERATGISRCRIITYLEHHGLIDRMVKGISPETKANRNEKVSQSVKEQYRKGKVSPLKNAKRMRELMKAKYGVEHCTKLPWVCEKIIKSRIENNGSYYTDEMKAKRDETMIEKYGSLENAYKERQEKYENTCLERYGAKNWWASKESQERNIARSMKLYGVKCAFNSEKQKQTMLERYGVDHNWKIPECHKKSELALKKIIEEENVPNWNEKFSEETKKVRLSSNVFRCTRCNEVFIDYSWANHPYYCPNCNNTSDHSSYVEIDIYNEISSIYQEEIIRHDRNILNGLELDIYLPKANLAIEVDGIFWHSMKPERDLLKTEICESKGIQLLHIWDIEWKRSKSIVLDKIKSVLGMNKRIFARKCKIVKISNEIYKEFCKSYHIQKSANAKYKYGLEYENEIVAIASFGKSRFEKGRYELIRYCSKTSISIIGGMKKLVANFKSEHGIKMIISYADRRYTTKLHSVYGDKLISITKPNYYYFKGKMIYSRIRFQKHKLKTDRLTRDFYDVNLTEKEICEKAGFRILYDCGQLKFEL